MTVNATEPDLFSMAIQCEHLNTLTNNDQYERALHAFGTGWAKVWDARSLIYRCQATRNHDVAIPFGGEMMLALSKVKAKTLIMPGRTDRTLPPYMAQEIRRGVKNNGSSLNSL